MKIVTQLNGLKASQIVHGMTIEKAPENTYRLMYGRHSVGTCALGIALAADGDTYIVRASKRATDTVRLLIHHALYLSLQD